MGLLQALTLHSPELKMAQQSPCPAPTVPALTASLLPATERAAGIALAAGSEAQQGLGEDLGMSTALPSAADGSE